MKWKNGNVISGNSDMDYIAFGSGKKNLIMIPGLGDGLKTVKGMALPFSIMYRQLRKEYRVYMFSRKKILQDGYTTHDAYGELPRIACPAMVIGGGCDQVVGTEAAGEIAERIAGSRLVIYGEYGHGVYEEAKDYLQKVLEFLK